MVFEFFLDLIFPPACVTCDDIGGYICERCYRKMQFHTHPIVIDLPKPSIDQLWACTTYTSTGRDFIHVYKFGEAFALAPIIGKLMAKHVPQINANFLTCVPLHRSRQRDRGFNQAQLLAKQISKHWQVPYLDTLVRTKATTPQAQLDRKQRLQHLKNAFTFRSSQKISGKTVLLVDDVATTATTLNECAKVLKQQGAKTVIGLVFAHGE